MSLSLKLSDQIKDGFVVTVQVPKRLLHLFVQEFDDHKSRRAWIVVELSHHFVLEMSWSLYEQYADYAQLATEYRGGRDGTGYDPTLRRMGVAAMKFIQRDIPNGFENHAHAPTVDYDERRFCQGSVSRRIILDQICEDVRSKMAVK